MEHAGGVTQAAADAPGPGKDASGAGYMNSVEAAATEPSDGGLAWALANAMEQGDWSQAESLQVAMLGGKGGGKGMKGQSQPYSAFVAAPIGIKMATILKETSGKGAKVEERALSIAPSIKENMEFRKIVDATFKGVACVFFKAPM